MSGNANAGQWIKSPDIALVVQEAISHADWDWNNKWHADPISSAVETDIVLLLRADSAWSCTGPNCSRSFYAWDNPGNADGAVLEIEWVKKDDEPFSRVRLDGQDNWNTNLKRNDNFNLQAGTAEEGIKVEFQVSQDDADAVLALETDGSCQGCTYHRWAVLAGTSQSPTGQSGIRMQVNDGSGWQYPQELISPLITDTWYVLTLKVGNGGWMYAEVYQKDDPSQRGTYVDYVAGDNWGFHSWVYRGTLWLDDYFELEHHTTQYAYDVTDNLTLVTDTLTNTTVITYDALGRKTGMTDPDMGTWAYAYDAVGNLISQTDARGCVINFGYDALNRLSGKTYGGPPPCGSMPAVGYSYDQGAYGIGRRTGMTDGSGSTTWSYDARGRVTQETKTISGVDSFMTSYTYYPNDQVETMTHPDGEVLTTTYNAMGLPESLSSATYSYVTSMAYNAAGQVKAINYNDGALSTQYGYYGYQAFVMGDPDDTPPSWGARDFGRLWRIYSYATTPHTVLQDLQYDYDPVGNVTRINDVKNGEDVSFTYDTLDRLISASGAYTTTYAYDAIGNITSFEGQVYTYTARPHAVAQAESNSYGNDANGNMTTRTVGSGNYALTYNAENRLTEVAKNGDLIATFVYDGDGNRVKAIVNGMTTVHIGDYYEQTGNTTRSTTTPLGGGWRCGRAAHSHSRIPFDRGLRS